MASAQDEGADAEPCGQEGSARPVRPVRHRAAARLARRRADGHDADGRFAGAATAVSPVLPMAVGAGQGGVPVVGLNRAVVLAAAEDALHNAARPAYGEASLEGADGVVAVGA